jgi:hypothetical protein
MRRSFVIRDLRGKSAMSWSNLAAQHIRILLIDMWRVRMFLIWICARCGRMSWVGCPQSPRSVSSISTRQIDGSHLRGKNRGALVIYGGLHFGAGMEDTLKDLVEHDHPNAFFTVLPYTGFVEKSCSLRFERNARDWPPPPALATPVRETSLEKELRPRNCHNEPPITLNFGPGVSQAEFARATARTEAVRAGTAGDALLYLGPARSLARAPIAPDIYLDPEYHAEIARRFELMTGNPLQLTVESNPMTLRPPRPSQ